MCAHGNYKFDFGKIILAFSVLQNRFNFFDIGKNLFNLFNLSFCHSKHEMEYYKHKWITSTQSLL